MSGQGVIQRTIGWRFVAGFCVGWLTLVFLVYPPYAGWWTAKDRLVDWLSAIGTMGSAIGAVVIATSQSYAAKRERKERGERAAALLTIDVARHLIALHAEINNARDLISDANVVVKLVEDRAAGRLLFLTSAEKLPDPRSLSELPADVADAVAVLTMTAGSYNHVIAKAVEVSAELPVQAAPALFTYPSLLDEVHRALVNSVERLQSYQPVLKTLDFRDRGDGTRLDD